MLGAASGPTLIHSGEEAPCWSPSCMTQPCVRFSISPCQEPISDKTSSCLHRVWGPSEVQPGRLHHTCQLNLLQLFAERCLRQLLARSLQRGVPSMSAPGAPEDTPEEGSKAKRANPRSHYRADGTRRRTKGEKKARQGHGEGHHSSGWTSEWWRKESPHAADVASSSGQRRAETTRRNHGERHHTSGWQADWWEYSQTPDKKESEAGEPTTAEAASSSAGGATAETTGRAELPALDRAPPLDSRNSLLARIPDGQGIPELREKLDTIRENSGLLHALLSSKPKDGRWTLLLEGSKANQDKAKEQIRRIMVQAQREPPTTAQSASAEGADSPAPARLQLMPPALPLSSPPGTRTATEPALDDSPREPLSTSESSAAVQRPPATDAGDTVVVQELQQQTQHSDRTVQGEAPVCIHALCACFC